MKLLLSLVLFLNVGPEVELIAHRGESHDAPENTLAAFKLAWERDVSTIELDVRLTGDRQLVLCHDKDTKRTTGLNLEVGRSTLAELQALDAGTWKAARWAGEKMPTLQQTLAALPAGRRCFIELKSGTEAVPALVEAIRRSGHGPDQLTIIDFNAASIAEVKRQLPDYPAYWLVSVKPDKTTGVLQPTARELIEKAQSIRADGLDLSGRLDRAYVDTIKVSGLKLFMWTINDPVEARRLVDLGVDGITTDRAAWLRQQLQTAAPAR